MTSTAGRWTGQGSVAPGYPTVICGPVTHRVSFTDRITVMNARSVELFRGPAGAERSDFLAERGETFLRVTEGLPPDTPVAVPWYGGGAALDIAVVTVTRDAPPRAYDCRIAAEPTAFLLVSFRRVPVRKAIARGGLRAGGRRPWLATRLGTLISTP
ncbi:hypothetical protein [Streptomyces sp. NPDC126503]|uniref:hypothetical protein n=1 Tax=Streptomyces sp. NPDC126503 TaxID=3155315 RepID=UPI003331D274